MRNSPDEALQREEAGRLSLIAERIGFTLWQLQELEGMAALYVVLITQAKKGMGSEAGIALLKPVQSLPFGGILTMITKANLLDSDLQARFMKVLDERNWLVHRSRGTSRNVISSGSGMAEVVGRVDVLAEEALALLRILGSMIDAYVREQDVSMEDVDERASTMLNEWHASDET